MTESLSKQVGRRIKAIRKQRGLTQARLARAALKSVETISHFERGRVSPGLVALEKIAEVLQCNVRDFFEEGDVVADSRSHSSEMEALINRIELLPSEDMQTVADLVKSLEKKSR